MTTGAKIPVLEIEDLRLKEDGRGFIVHNDASNFVIQSATPWTSTAYDQSGASTRTDHICLPVASSLGWLKIHYVSGSTYGPTGATCYIPVFRNLNIDTA